MKKYIFILLLIAGAAIAQNWSKLEVIFNSSFNSSKELQNPVSISGFYEQDRKVNPETPLGLKFLSDRLVEMYSGNEKLGNTVSYSVNGKSLDVTHSCGVWHMEIRGDRLYHKDLKCDFIKKYAQ